MRSTLVRRLAKDGLISRRKTTIPFLAARIVSCMMVFSIFVLASDPSVAAASHGSAAFPLSLGAFIVALVAFLFLSQVWRYLLRQRGRELGVYEVAGMTKRDVLRMLRYELGMLFVATVVPGILLGMGFSSLMHQALMALMHIDGASALSFAPSAFELTVMLFAAIDVLNLVSARRMVAKLQVTELLKSASATEEAPKVNVAVLALGIVLVGAAYALSQRAASAADHAFDLFMPVAFLIVLGTFCLFREGSVVLLRALQKDLRFYRTRSHFVSVSGLIFRMRRNASGLATICVLSCMTLVCVISTLSIFRGIASVVDRCYPHDVEIMGFAETLPDYSGMDQALSTIASRHGGTDIAASHSLGIFGDISGSVLDESGADWSIALVDQKTYADAGYGPLDLGADEIAIATNQGIENSLQTFEMAGSSFRIKSILPSELSEQARVDDADRFAYIVVPDLSQVASLADGDGYHFGYSYAFDLPDSSAENEQQVLNELAATAAGDGQHGFGEFDTFGHEAMIRSY